MGASASLKLSILIGAYSLKKMLIPEAEPASYSLDGIDFCCACVHHRHEL